MKTLPQPWTVAMEATIFTGWIYDHLLPHAQQVKVAHPLMLRVIAAAKKKNDRIDAGKIADCLRCDFLPECHMAPTPIRDRRRTLRYRHLLVRQMVQMKNRISGLLMETGVSYNKQRLHKVRYFHELLSTNEEVNESIRPLFVQRVGDPTATELAGTESASYPFWSPDNAYVGFFAKAKLMKIPASGGSSQALAVAHAGRGASWGAKNVILYTPEAQGGMWRVNADGRAAAPLNPALYSKGEQSHRWPVFLSDGDHFLFWAGDFINNPDDRISGIYESSLDAKEKKLILLTYSNVGVGPDHIFYVDPKRRLVSSPFDVSKGAVSGEPQVVSDSVGYMPATLRGTFSASADGRLVYSTGTGTSLSQLTWLDRSGKELGHIGEPGTISNPILSPDDRRVAVDIADLKANTVDIWLEAVEGNSSTRFTFGPSEDVNGVWSRDGRTIAYRSVGEAAKLLAKAASGLERERTVLSIDISQDILANSWTLDDQQILCTAWLSNSSSDRATGLFLVPASGGQLKPFLETRGSDRTGQISPNGKWVVYASTESGDWEIYVTTFPDAAGKWQVSRGGGTEPRWRGDGKELYYIGQPGMLMAATVSTEGGFSTGTPAPLFPLRGRTHISSTDQYTYDVTSDGQRFLVNRFVKADHPTPLTIVLSATAGGK